MTDLVVDADGHCSEPEEGLARWMAKQYADRVPRRIADNPGQLQDPLRRQSMGKSEGLGPGVSGPFADHIRGSRPGMRDPAERLVDMDTEGIDVAVIFGTSIALTVNGIQDKGLAAATCHAVNEWLVEEYWQPTRNDSRGWASSPARIRRGRPESSSTWRSTGSPALCSPPTFTE